MKNVGWCTDCDVPLLQEICDYCGSHSTYEVAPDLSPVFAEEMLLLRKCLGFHSLPKRSQDMFLWSNGTYYYHHGQRIAKQKFGGSDAPTIELLKKGGSISKNGRYGSVKASERFVRANITHLHQMKHEAKTFIQRTLNEDDRSMPVVPFSGGKDSTVVSALARQVIPPNDLLHIFVDTGLESPETHRFVDEFHKANPAIPFLHARPNVDFFDMCELLGPPSRIKRWCCSTQKTFPLGMIYGILGAEKQITSLCGVRKCESVSRQYHKRVLDKTKIAEEKMICPILEWRDIEVWLFLIAESQPFNRDYRRGFRRIGCLHCPYNSEWSEFLKAAYYKRAKSKWEKTVKRYYEKRSHGTEDCDPLKRWKARAGGLNRNDDLAGMSIADCEDDPMSFSVICERTLSEDFWEFFRPFGNVCIDFDDGSVARAQVLDAEERPLFLVQVSKPRRHVRCTILVTANRRLLKQRIVRQIRKAVACVSCGICQVTCPHGAILCNGKYVIDPVLCTHCLQCVTKPPRGCVAAHATNVSGKR